MYRFVFHSVGLILFCKGVFICNCEPLMRLCVAGCFCDQTLVLGCLSSARGRSWTLSDCGCFGCGDVTLRVKPLCRTQDGRVAEEGCWGVDVGLEGRSKQWRCILKPAVPLQSRCWRISVSAPLSDWHKWSATNRFPLKADNSTRVMCFPLELLRNRSVGVEIPSVPSRALLVFMMLDSTSVSWFKLTFFNVWEHLWEMDGHKAIKPSTRWIWNGNVCLQQAKLCVGVMGWTLCFGWSWKADDLCTVHEMHCFSDHYYELIAIYI